MYFRIKPIFLKRRLFIILSFVGFINILSSQTLDNCCNGAVEVWGNTQWGGNPSTEILEQLSSGVLRVYGTSSHFAALKCDGSVVTWGGAPTIGQYDQWVSDLGDSLSSDVIDIASCSDSFAALKSDGTVVTWGLTIYDGIGTDIPNDLIGVTQIFNTTDSFAALKSDGSVVTWGNQFGGDSSSVASELSSGVVNIFNNGYSFAALKSDGSVVTWGGGNGFEGGDSSSVASELQSGVIDIASGDGGWFAALKSDGSVVTWGELHSTFYDVQDQLNSGVVKIYPKNTFPAGSTEQYEAGNNFIAIKENGSVVTWGEHTNCSDCVSPYEEPVLSQLSSDVVSIFTGSNTIAALKSDGSVVTWGLDYSGGDSSSVSAQLSSGVVDIVAGSNAMAALKEDGSVVIWGYPPNPTLDNAPGINSGALKLFNTIHAFGALMNDGSIRIWGLPEYGGSAPDEFTTPGYGITDIQFNAGAGIVIISDDVSPPTGETSQSFCDEASISDLEVTGENIIWYDAAVGGNILSVSDTLSDGQVVYASQTIDDCESIERLAVGVEITSCCGGSLVAWGLSAYGGDISTVADQLSSGVIDVNCGGGACTALKSDGSIVTWGTSNGTLDNAPSINSGVIKIYSGDNAYAALLDDGSIRVWGLPQYGGSFSGLEAPGSGVIDLKFNAGAGIALLQNGSVTVWGNPTWSGSPSDDILNQISSGVVKIFNTDSDFAVLKDDGSVVTWGSTFNFDQYVSIVSDAISSGVIDIFTNGETFAALKEDGAVVSWGANENQGFEPFTLPSNTVINSFHNTSNAFAVILGDNSVFTWGSEYQGGNSSNVSSSLSSGVVDIFNTGGAFAAIKENGSVVTWGSAASGGDSSLVASELSSGVVSISSSQRVFVAIKDDGSLVGWGDQTYGGNLDGIEGIDSGVVRVFPESFDDPYTTENEYGFAALKDDGSVITWSPPFFDPNNSNSCLSPDCVNPFEEPVLSQIASGVTKIFSSQAAFVALKSEPDEAPLADLDPLPQLTEQCELTALTAPTATDNCDGIITGVTTTTLPITASTTITWTYTDLSGNSSTQTQDVVIFYLPPPTGSNTQSFCEFNNPTIADLLLDQSDIVWYSSNNGTISLNNNSSLVNGQIYYGASIDPANGCESLDRFAVEVIINDPPPPSGLGTQEFCLEVNPTIADLSVNGNSILWYDSPFNGNQLSTSLSLNNGDVVYATNYDSNTGCESSQRLEIQVNVIDSDLEYYNLITVNQNNLNDKLKIIGIESFQDNNIEIFNRYGKLVWSSYGYNNNDVVFLGKSNVSGVYAANEFLPTGTYYFILNYNNPCENKVIKGFIHIDNKGL